MTHQSKLTVAIASALSLLLLSPTSSFTAQSKLPWIGRFHSSSPSGQLFSSSSPPSSSGDLFSSEGWPLIKADLDKVPIFCCANAEGKPMAYSVEVKGESFTVPFFFCDVDDAQAELEKAKSNTDMEGLGLIPFPLGKAFEMWANDKAVIVPGSEAIKQAGAPPGSNPIGQEVPLFACMDIMQEVPPGPDGKGGGPCLPMFMVLEEANAAMEEALSMDGGNADDFEVVSLSLPRAVELLATVPETPAFNFIPPAKSIQHIEEYLSN